MIELKPGEDIKEKDAEECDRCGAKSKKLNKVGRCQNCELGEEE